MSLPRATIVSALAALAALVVMIAGCSSAPPKPSAAELAAPAASTTPAAAPTPVPAPTASSKYYKDDGPGEAPPANLEQIPDAVPKLEALHRFANRPYTVLGRDYVPATTLRPYKERGIASWYGRKFHGQKTSNGETYDMYAMTAAHPTLPLPSYVKVTNVVTGRSVVVRVNDRGPFLHGRIIDLSYAAAHRIGTAAKGSGEVEVEAILLGNSPAMLAAAPLPQVAASSTSTPTGSGVTTAPLRTAEAPAPISRESSGGYSVQLGAFQNYANAQTFLAHIQGQLAAAQVEPKVRQTAGLYRIYVGPYPDREEARRVADRITVAFGVATAIAPH
ncbi:MAG: septal ring lytic transglycosylase RlpA family protein [Casimicrobiaceae bacterium]